MLWGWSDANLGPIDPLITVPTEITLDDHKAYLQFVGRRGMPANAITGTTILFWIGIFIVTLTIMIVGWQVYVLSGLIGFVLGLLFVLILAKRQARRLQPVEGGFILGARTVSVTEEGIGEKSDRHQSFFPWRTVREIGMTERHVFVFVDRAAAYVVPRRAFANEGVYRRFVEEVQRRCSGALPT